MVGEKIGIYSSQLVKNTLKSSTIVGENLGIYSSQLAKNTLKSSTMVGEKFEFTHLNWLKIHLNCLPWLEKI